MNYFGDPTIWLPFVFAGLMGVSYRNSENKTLSTLPFLNQGENMLTGVLDSLIPGNSLSAPLTTTIGNRSRSETRRELVFLIKAEAWSPALSLGNELGFDDAGMFNIDIDLNEEEVSSEELITELTEIPEEAPAPTPEVAPEGEKK